MHFKMKFVENSCFLLSKKFIKQNSVEVLYKKIYKILVKIRLIYKLTAARISDSNSWIDGGNLRNDSSFL